MKIEVELGCIEGSAELHYARDKSGGILIAGQSSKVPVLDTPALPAEPTKEAFADWAKANIEHAWQSAGIGQNGRQSGVVYAKALQHSVTIRQYLEVNHFLDPDAEDYKDHRLNPGQRIDAETVSSNVVTLIVMAP